LKEQPEEIKGEIFTELYNDMELKNLTSTEMESYQISEYKYEDFYNFTDYAEKKGMEKGIKKGRKEGMEKGIEKGMKTGLKTGLKTGVKKVAEKLLAMGMPVDDISKATGLSIDEIRQME
jgi:predicted transposase/invertase (TIGR01784 family)